jgi:hypothetical protein
MSIWEIFVAIIIFALQNYIIYLQLNRFMYSRKRKVQMAFQKILCKSNFLADRKIA